MHKYIPHTNKDIEEMLTAINIKSIDDLFIDIPKAIRFNGNYNLENALSEIEVTKKIEALANKNNNNMIPFIGAGAYDHYIPSIINHITTRSEFSTAYTPYQPEVSQGTLTYIFEYQSMITAITDMEVSNASLYDGFTAAAEAAMMMKNATKRNKILISNAVNPSYINVIKTYAHFQGMEIEFVSYTNGKTNISELKNKLNDNIAGFIFQTPNFFGLLEGSSEMVSLLHENKSLVTVLGNPLAFALFKTPGELNIDIVAGDAQVFGIPLSYGGPYLGYMATKKKLMRKMPGRICGETKDVDGKRAYVLTLQAREQHIRREKANSNICSNQSLNALAATVFCATMGKHGIQEMANQNYQKAHYAFNAITNLKNFHKCYDGEFFNEFVVKTNIEYELIKQKLEENNIIPGLNLGDGKILFCVTEKRTKVEIELLISLLGEL